MSVRRTEEGLVLSVDELIEDAIERCGGMSRLIIVTPDDLELDLAK